MSRLVPLACLVALAGCRPADDVRTYTVPKPSATASTAPAPAGDVAKVHFVDVTGPTDRLLGALIPTPAGDPRPGFYSLKLSGPTAAVAERAAAFRALAESVRLTGRPADPLAYSVPPGWTAGPSRQMRLATLVTGPAGSPDVGVFPSFGGSLLENVNRWRGQVGVAATTEADLPTAAPELNPAGPPAAPTK